MLFPHGSAVFLARSPLAAHSSYNVDTKKQSAKRSKVRCETRTLGVKTHPRRAPFVLRRRHREGEKRSGSAGVPPALATQVENRRSRRRRRDGRGPRDASTGRVWASRQSFQREVSRQELSENTNSCYASTSASGAATMTESAATIHAQRMARASAGAAPATKSGHDRPAKFFRIQPFEIPRFGQTKYLAESCKP